MLNLTSKQKEKILFILDSGDDAQIDKVLEELRELHQAVLDYSKHKDNISVTEHVIEEMADVIVTVQELIYLLNISENILESWVDFKINRTVWRLKNGYYKK